MSLFSTATCQFRHLTVNLAGLGPAAPPPASVQKPETPQPVQKPPVPVEHEILQRVFEDLKNRCNSAAGNPVSLYLIRVKYILCLCYFSLIANKEET